MRAIGLVSGFNLWDLETVLFLFMFLLLSAVHSARCCRAPMWVSSLAFLGSQQRELTSGGHFRVLKFVIVVYLWSLDSLEQAHKSGHFQALKKATSLKFQ